MLDTDEKLAKFLPALRTAEWVAVDTEADSLHAYPEKVCLIQISTAHGDRLVDPLAGIDLNPLLDSLSGHVLLMHGADYDLRLLRKHHAFTPGAIFDTMLAARLLGIPQFGLQSLVERYLGVKLEKGPQKANWAMRPLTPRMEAYARNDTHYLKPLSDRMRQELQAKGRLEWHEETCARLILEATQEPRNGRSDAWRIKGCHALSRPGLAILRELWQWRESEAIAANKPPFFILSHDCLVTVAGAAADGKEVLNCLPRHLSERRRGGLLKAVARGKDIPSDQLPSHVRQTGRRPSEAERRRYTDIQKHRDLVAKDLDLDPTLIASRSVLSDLAHDWEKNSKSLMKWQKELLTRKPSGPGRSSD